MFINNRLGRIIAIPLVFVAAAGLMEAKSRKGSQYMAQGRKAEQLKQWDQALALYEQALAEDPGEISYTMAVRRMRFEAGQKHVEQGQRMRQDGNVEQALMEFQRAYAIDTTSSIAMQEIRRTKAILEREKTEKPKPGERGMTPVEHERKAVEDRVATTLGAPELKPISRQPITLRMNNQPPRVVFETVGKLAGVNVIMDPDFSTMGGAPRPVNVELNNTTLEQALDYVAILTKCFWKPLSANTILVTQDNPTKRRDYEDQVVKVFYLTNVSTTQDLNEISSTVRGITDIRRVFVCASQYAIVVRGEVDKVALAEKLIRDMDKPKSEVIIDVLVMQASRSRTRDLTAALTSGGAAGLSTPITFTPRNGTTTTTSSTGTTGTTSTSTSSMTLAKLGKVSTSDFSVTMPGGLLNMVMTDSTTRILQSPQVRASDGQKASLRIGDKTPISTGGMQPYGSGVGTTGGLGGGLYQSFQFIDVGVNVDITPKVHGTDEVSLHVELEISSVKERIDVGGVSQPVIGQNKVVHDIRIREGEVNILGGLSQVQSSKSVGGIPGINSIPLLRRLFSSDSTTNSDSELLIALIPHIIRSQDITETNLKEIATGSDAVFHLSYAPKRGPENAAPPTPIPAPPAEKLPAALPAPPAFPTAPVGPPKLSFAPMAVETQAGSEVSLRLDISNAADLFSAPVHIRFDPKILRLNEVVKGNLLESDGKQLLFTRNIRNDEGEVSINISRLPGAGGITSSGPLLFLNFQTVGRGVTRVSVSEINAKDSKMQPVLLAPPQAAVNIK